MNRKPFRLIGAYIEICPTGIFAKPMKGKPLEQEITFKTEDGHTIVVRLLEHQVYDLQDNKLGMLP